MAKALLRLTQTSPVVSCSSTNPQPIQSYLDVFVFKKEKSDTGFGQNFRSYRLRQREKKKTTIAPSNFPWTASQPQLSLVWPLDTNGQTLTVALSNCYYSLTQAAPLNIWSLHFWRRKPLFQLGPLNDKILFKKLDLFLLTWSY